VTSYRQYCPVARASEILAERWSLLIVRNLMWGATTFTELANGAPHVALDADQAVTRAGT
jgi:DNA-binding HxlR family transcriptional regulator